MLGLLHVGFNVPLRQLSWEEEKEHDCIYRLIFYFTIADGWVDNHILRLPEDVEDNGMYSDGKTTRQFRQKLALKAFDMLCVNFFKTAEVHGSGRLSWTFGYQWDIVVSERLFPTIQNFFREESRTECGGDVKIRNLMIFNEIRPGKSQWVINFLLNLARFMWTYTWEKTTRPSANSIKERDELTTRFAQINAAKPWMVTVLAKLDELGVLREWILDLDKASLAKLKEIALRSKLEIYHQVPESRQVLNLDEACYAGSKAAWFLAEHEVMVHEHKRLTSIREAEEQRREAERKIAKLNGSKK